MTSFGAWVVLNLFLSPKQFLRLQALNKFAYNIGVSRAQLSLRVEEYCDTLLFRFQKGPLAVRLYKQEGLKAFRYWTLVHNDYLENIKG